MKQRSPGAERVCAALLRLTPAALRHEAATEMLSIFRDSLRAARSSGRPLAMSRFWVSTLRDLWRTTRSPHDAAPLLRHRIHSESPDGAPMLDLLLKDLRFAIRSLARSPGFSIVIVLTLALGIGANTAIFSVVDGVLLRPLPFPEPHQLVAVWADYTQINGRQREWLSFPDFHNLRQLSEVFEEVGTWSFWDPTLTDHGDEPEQISAVQMSQGLLSRVLRVSPATGRGVLPEEDEPDAERVVVVSHRLWERVYQSSDDAVGSTMQLDGEPYTIVGIMPADLRPPFIPRADVWAPQREDISQHFGGRGSASYLALGRLREGVSVTSAQAAASALGARLEAEFPESNTNRGFFIYPLHDDLVSSASTALWVLLGAVGFVLLMACVNVANLLLAQASSRAGEIGVRTALGASRHRIVRQLLAESALLASVGGVLGAALGFAGTRLLVRMAPSGTPRIEHVALDARVLVFTAIASLGAAIVFGLLPALRASRTDVQAALKEGGRSGDGAAHGRPLRSALVVVQVALALVMLVGAGLLLRTFQQLNAVDLGFRTERLLTVSLNLPGSRYADGTDQVAFYQELERRLRALPGVESVGAVNSLPLGGRDGDADFNVEGMAPAESGESRVSWIRRVTPHYGDAMGMRLTAGRFFNESDDTQAARVVVVNETLASRYFPNADPVGKRIYFGSDDDPTYRTIVGVIGDTKHFGIAQSARNATYFPYAQVPTGFMTMVIRTTGDPTSVTPAARREITALDRLLAASNIGTMEAVVGSSLAIERFVATLMSAFALVALTLAVVGLYGVVSYGVSLRQREMGVRMALGAGAGDIRRMVVGGSLGLIVIGVALGLAGALAVTRLLEGLLFDVRPTDPATFGAVVVTLFMAGGAAALVPARRAARVDPAAVLNRE